MKNLKLKIVSNILPLKVRRCACHINIEKRITIYINHMSFKLYVALQLSNDAQQLLQYIIPDRLEWLKMVPIAQ